MPLYMDRHDVSENVTAETLAELHQKDLKCEHHFGCRGITYWFDDKRKTAFCLIEAPSAEALQNMHDHAHGDVPHSIIEVDPNVVEAFLGRITDPVKTGDTELNVIRDPAFRTIMVIALNRAIPLLNGSFDHFNEAITRIVTNYDGKIVNQSRYQYLVSFKSVTNAIQASQDVQTKAKIESVELKIALNAGVPVTGKKEIFEDAIRHAERMCGMVRGEIIVSAEVKELYQAENGNTFPDNKTIFALSQADEKFLAMMMDYTDTASNNTDLKVDDFSKPMGYSKSQLYRKLVALTDKSPNTFIKEYRLHEAVKLLDNNAGNISEVAFRTGFSSPSYFSKCFQKRFGYPPSEYLPAKQEFA